MEQSITLKIAGKDFPLKAPSPEMEQIMRLAAEDVNARLAKYAQMYPDKSLEDKFALVCLNEAINMLSFKRKLGMVSEEVSALKAQTDAYLSKVSE